ncbi:MAG: hypothetical protein IKT06_02025 [Aeriscardovia sp.]|nr:hypothetical protein [Aeriscardovia sp.]
MEWAVLAIWVLVILLVGALVMWAAGKEASSSFLSSFIPGSPAWEKRKKREEEKRLGKARIVGSFKIPPLKKPEAPLQPRRVLATSSSVIEVKSLKRTPPPLPKKEGPSSPPLPKL